jgi:6-phosphogluconolactonase
LKIEILDNGAAVAARAAEVFAECARSSDSGFEVALAGGSTPKLLYRMLAAEPWSDQLPWNNISWFFGDERFVSSDDEKSNFRMARENLFDLAKVDGSRIFRVRTELGDAGFVAADYERLVREHVPADAAGVPQFDLILLGMGADGHTASLFPGTAALSETKRIVCENFVDKLGSWRITLTIPVLMAARQIVITVTGAEKAEALAQVLEGDRDIERLPCQILRNRISETLWLVDKAAASNL